MTTNRTTPSLSRLFSDESGQDLIEYALIATLIGIAAITAIRGVSIKLGDAFTFIGTGLTSAS